MIPGPARILHIYDSSDFMIDLTASIRRLTGSASIYKIAVEGRFDLVDALDKLVSDGETFSRCIFETHGSPGAIYFGQDLIDGDVFRGWTNRGYNKVFNLWSHIYFNGCNIADNETGWDFLDGAGKLFLTHGGGQASAQSEVGRPILFTGHVVHFGAKVCRSVWAPGGVFLGHTVE
jgi:hypothetical protein